MDLTPQAHAEASPPPPVPTGAALPSRRLRGLARRAVQAVLGLAVGLGLTEAAFRHRDGGAFPQVDVYEADPLRGVCLAPGSATLVGGPGERPTHVRINRAGYRGADWPAPAPSDVLVVGDSISFGLGVEEDEALAARLHAALPGAPAVLDASVPTYGPPEYLMTLEQLLPLRHPARVVLVINLINDLAEIDHPNRDRHTALDGWAVRVDPTRPAPPSSPLTTAAIQRSHAAFALWRWIHARERTNAEPEPGLEGLLQLAGRVAAASRAVDDHRREEARRAAAIVDAQVEVRAAKLDLVALVKKTRPLVYYGSSILSHEWDDYLLHEGEPVSDLFDIPRGCGAPPRAWGEDGWVPAPPPTARFSGQKIREDVESYLKELAPVLPPADRGAVPAAFARRAAAETRLASLPSTPLPPPPPLAPSPFAPFLARAQAVAAAGGARLMVVVAPLDAQASPEARQRRALTEAEAAMLEDVSATIVAEARAAGAEGVAATGALRAVGAAAFLPDGHLTAAGHDAVARAIAAVTAGG